MTRFVVICSIVLAVLTWGTLGAQPPNSLKIGVIDLQQCLNDSKEGKKARKLLEAKHATLKTRLQAAQDDLEALKNEMDSQGMMMSAEVLAEKDRTYRRKQRDFKDMLRDFNEEMAQDENEMKVRIFTELADVIKVFAAAEGYTIVFEKRSLLYSVPGIDATQRIIEAYDASKGKK